MAADRAPSINRARAMLAAGFLLLTGLLVGAYALSTIQDASAQQMQRAEGVRRTLSQVLLAIGDAETAQRGLLLTGQKLYLTPFHEALAKVPALLRDLEGQIHDPHGHEQLVDLRALLDDKTGELKRALADYQGGRRDVAVQAIRSNVGRRMTVRIRALVRTMEADYDYRVALGRASRRVTSIWLLVGASASVLAIIALATLTLLELSRRHRLVVAMRDELLASNRALTESAGRQEMLEEAMRQSRKMEALGALTGGMAHDFNNMLAVILGNLELMQTRLADGSRDVRRYVDYALESTRRAAELTRRLLAFARKQPLNPVAVSLHRVVTNIAEVIRRTLGEIYTIGVIEGRGLWPVVVDVNQLESALINLAVNARDAMPGGGTLTIETANVQLDDAYTSGQVDLPYGQYVMVAVTDTGSGMPPEVARKAFDPFFTTKEIGKGTGLGLSQVYGFVKQSGGHVEIASELTKGTTVRLYFPRAELEASEGSAGWPPAASEELLPRGNAGTVVLLVEDDPAVRGFAEEALAELGYGVLSVPSGHSALTMLESHPEIAVLLTDIMMAEMTGKQLADLAVAMRPQLKVLYMTGFTRDAVMHNGVLDSGVELLNKPFTLEELARKLRRVLS